MGTHWVCGVPTQESPHSGGGGDSGSTQRVVHDENQSSPLKFPLVEARLRSRALNMNTARAGAASSPVYSKQPSGMATRRANTRCKQPVLPPLRWSAPHRGTRYARGVLRTRFAALCPAPSARFASHRSRRALPTSGSAVLQPCLLARVGVFTLARGAREGSPALPAQHRSGATHRLVSHKTRKRDLANCGSGLDIVIADAKDVVDKSCEIVRLPREAAA